jgi:thioesterase domain-containing protein
MTAADLLAELRELDVHIVLDGDRLRLNAPVGVLTDEHKRNLAQRKPEVIAFLREAQRLGSQQRSIVPLEPAGTRTPIFAVAGHNGDVFAYRALAHHLGPDQPFFGLQPPGLEEGSEPLTRVEDVARYFAEQIRAFQPVGQMTIAGYCAGGSVAFELARQLTNTGAGVTNLILFGAPYCKFYRRLQWTMAVVRHYSSRSMTHARTLVTIPVAERGSYVAQRARHLAERARGLLEQKEADEVTDPVLARRGAVVKATLAAARAYSPKSSSIHIDFMLPCESWKRSSAHPLAWSRFAASTTEFVGPDGCSGDTMLLPEHAATFAAFVAEARQRQARSVSA